MFTLPGFIDDCRAALAERARAVHPRANARWAAEQARETAAPPAR
jgi:hypothetical protein